MYCWKRSSDRGGAEISSSVWGDDVSGLASGPALAVRSGLPNLSIREVNRRFSGAEKARLGLSAASLSSAQVNQVHSVKVSLLSHATPIAKSCFLACELSSRVDPRSPSCN